MRYILMLVSVITGCMLILLIIIPLENQLRDCQFECNHLQTRLTRCQELSDCAEALEQTLPPLAWAQVRALNEGIKQKRRWEYEHE